MERWCAIFTLNVLHFWCIVFRCETKIRKPGCLHDNCVTPFGSGFSWGGNAVAEASGHTKIGGVVYIETTFASKEENVKSKLWPKWNNSFSVRVLIYKCDCVKEWRNITNDWFCEETREEWKKTSLNKLDLGMAYQRQKRMPGVDAKCMMTDSRTIPGNVGGVGE